MRFPVFLLFGLAPVPALSASDPVAECRAAYSSDPQAHIECLEAALQTRNVQPADDGVVSAQAEVAVPVTVATPAAVEAAVEPPPPSGMGAEQVRAEEQKESQDEELRLHIISTSYNSRGLGTFRTEEGQVWRETTPSPERRRLKPDKQYTARIVRSKFGGYRMHVDGVKWMKTVERIE
jgi:hypothetical protein